VTVDLVIAFHACLPNWVTLAAAAETAQVREVLEVTELWEVKELPSSSVVKLLLLSWRDPRIATGGIPSCGRAQISVAVDPSGCLEVKALVHSTPFQ
jgi:hypothetical protein